MARSSPAPKAKQPKVKPKKALAKRSAPAPKRPKVSTPAARTKAPTAAAVPPAPPPPSRVDGAAALLAQAAQRWAGTAAAQLSRAGAVALHAGLQAGGGWLVLTTGLHDRGFELTLRIAPSPGEATPPAWALALLKHVVDWAADGPTDLAPVLLPLPKGLLGAPAEELGAALFSPDPTLTPVNGVRPFAVVPLLWDEARLVREWSPQGFVEVLAKVDPALTADPARVSMLLSPRARTAIEARVEREGSALGSLDVPGSTLQVGKAGVSWELPVDGAQAFVSLLKGRLAHGRPFELRGEEHTLRVLPGDQPAVLVDPPVTLKLTLQAARAMRATLRGAPGTYRWDEVPGLTLVVRAS